MMSDQCFAILVVLAIVAGIASVGALGGAYLKNWQCEARAVEAGVARYVCDPNTGETTFEFIKP